jgi:hypothetical protein
MKKPYEAGLSPAGQVSESWVSRPHYVLPLLHRFIESAEEKSYEDR